MSHRFSTCLVLLTTALLVQAGCEQQPSNSTPGGSTAASPQEINLYIFSEYIDPELLEKFKAETGIEVRVSTYESTEDAISKLGAGGGDRLYDVVVLSNQAMHTVISQGLVQQLDKSKLPNLVNLDPQFADPVYDPQGAHSVPYQWGTTGIIYRKDMVELSEESWSVVFAADQQPGTFLLIDETRDMLGAALKYLGHSLNSTEAAQIKQAGDLIIAAKQSDKCKGFDGGVGAKNRVLAGDVAMGIVWNGDAVRATAENENCVFFIPKEGTIKWVDLMVVPRHAPHAQAAHQFINFLLDAENGAQLSNFNQFATPNAAAMAFITPEDRENPAIYPTPETKATLEFAGDTGPATRFYDEVWTAIKSR